MKEKIKIAYKPRDILLVFGENTIRDLERTTNLLFEKLNEWYSIYFPELKLEDRAKYCRLVQAIDKERMDQNRAKIKEIMPEKGEEIFKKLQNSSGIDLTEKDLESIRTLATAILALMKEQQEKENYVEGIAREVCPNLAEVGGPRVAAKLIAHVGGIEKLAKLPSSTIQVLGAEKALFKHLKRKTKPPKHGLIFQHSAIHSAPKEQRGRIARALASQLSIAIKVDAYGKRFIGKELREKFEHRLKEIQAEKHKP
jgi:nucleolar protein 56